MHLFHISQAILRFLEGLESKATNIFKILDSYCQITFQKLEDNLLVLKVYSEFHIESSSMSTFVPDFTIPVMFIPVVVFISNYFLLLCRCTLFITTPQFI